MGKIKDDQVLRASKEIVVKFIETGRVPPTTFSDVFKNIYHTIEETVKGPEPPSEQKKEVP